MENEQAWEEHLRTDMACGLTNRWSMSAIMRSSSDLIEAPDAVC